MQKQIPNKNARFGRDIIRETGFLDQEVSGKGYVR